jgi:hypothetical protein
MLLRKETFCVMAIAQVLAIVDFASEPAPGVMLEQQRRSYQDGPGPLAQVIATNVLHNILKV